MKKSRKVYVSLCTIIVSFTMQASGQGKPTLGALGTAQTLAALNQRITALERRTKLTVDQATQALQEAQVKERVDSLEKQVADLLAMMRNSEGFNEACKRNTLAINATLANLQTDTNTLWCMAHAQEQNLAILRETTNQALLNISEKIDALRKDGDPEMVTISPAQLQHSTAQPTPTSWPVIGWFLGRGPQKP